MIQAVDERLVFVQGTHAARIIRRNIGPCGPPMSTTLFLSAVSAFASFGLLACAAAVPPASAPQSAPAPPVAERKPHTTAVHGDILTDDYFWLREKTNPKVTEYLQAEDAYADEMMKPTSALQASLYAEMLGHIKQTDETVPYFENGYFYYSRTREGLQYPIYCRKRGSLTAPEEVILDQNELAKGKAFTDIGARVVTDDGSLLAFTVDDTGYRQFT